MWHFVLEIQCLHMSLYYQAYKKLRNSGQTLSSKLPVCLILISKDPSNSLYLYIFTISVFGSQHEVLELQQRISSSSLEHSDKSLVSGVLDFNIWLGEELSQARLSIKRLQTLFGVSTEKKSPTPVHPLMQRVES